MDELRLGDTPDALLQAATARLHPYSTALFRVESSDRLPFDARHIGSGTFLSVGAKYGVLTAYHVSAALAGPCQLGLSAAREAEEQHMRIPKTSIEIVEVARPRTEEMGPDLSFVVLADAEDVGTIRASRSFLPIESDAGVLLERPPALEQGIWFLCGAPQASFNEVPSERGFAAALSFQDLCLAGGPSTYFERDGFDYFELDADVGAAIPTTLRGMSGGGLWQVAVVQSPDGALTPGRALLRGVAFFEGLREDRRRFVRCHGDRSIYEHVRRAIS